MPAPAGCRVRPAGLPQGGEAFGNQVLVRGEVVVGQGFPVRQQAHAQAGGEPGNFVEQALGVTGAGGDHGQETGFFPGQLRHEQRVGRTRKRRQLDAIAGFPGGEGEGQRCGNRIF